MNTVGLAKAIMKLGEVRPASPLVEIGTCQELFRHERFIRGADTERRAIMLASSQKEYAEELAYPWDNYFGVDLAPYLSGREALDLGCFSGGRSVAWFERYGFKRLLGIDVAPEFIDAARCCAREDTCWSYSRATTRRPSITWPWRAAPELEAWEKGNAINGTTYRGFGKLIREGGWKVVMNSRAPVGSIGRNASRKLSYRLMSRLFAPLTALPGLQEIFLHRMTYILEKPAN